MERKRFLVGLSLLGVVGSILGVLLSISGMLAGTPIVWLFASIVWLDNYKTAVSDLMGI